MLEWCPDATMYPHGERRNMPAGRGRCCCNYFWTFCLVEWNLQDLRAFAEACQKHCH